MFASRNQLRHEKVVDYADELRWLFREAYPTGDVDTPVFLQRFLTGLLQPIAKQVLLQGRPGSMEEAVKVATDIQYALQFGEVDTEEVYPLVDPKVPTGTEKIPEALVQLQQAVEQLMRRFDALENRTEDQRRRQP